MMANQKGPKKHDIVKFLAPKVATHFRSELLLRRLSEIEFCTAIGPEVGTPSVLECLLALILFSQCATWTRNYRSRHASAARTFFERVYCNGVAPPLDQRTDHVKKLLPAHVTSIAATVFHRTVPNPSDTEFIRITVRCYIFCFPVSCWFLS